MAVTERIKYGGYEPPFARRRFLGQKSSPSQNTNLSPSISYEGDDSRRSSWSAVLGTSTVDLPLL